MAQTKRKRRNKHRGNAVGMVEARGRTSKPGSDTTTRGRATGGGGARTRRPVPLKPPSWQSAALKALFGVLILFLFFTLLSDSSPTQALGFCSFAFLAYTPIMYFTDKFIYSRKLKQQAAAKR